jgi:hypothetical protein
MTHVSNQLRTELEARVLAKASTDEHFRSALISSPRSALEQELRIKLPASIDIRVVEESAESFYLVLPQKNPVADRGELSDLELETVAGGKSPDKPAAPKSPLRSEPIA